MIVPVWRSSVFWPVLCPNGVHFASFIHDYRFFPFGNNVVMRGKRNNSIFGASGRPLQLLALRSSFEVPPCNVPILFVPYTPLTN